MGVKRISWPSIIGVCVYQQPTGSSKQQIRTRYLGHVTGHQLIKDQHFWFGRFLDCVLINVLQYIQYLSCI